MPIDKISIVDFQRHKKLEIEFDPAVTTLVGQTDAGKSAVVRAIRWAALNRPAGDAFLRNGAQTVRVALLVDGAEIVRRRGRGGNAYKLNGRKFAAMGGNVPEPIAAVLNIDELNFAGQFAPPFWLSDSPGAVSQQLNAVVDLAIIDESTRAAASKSREAAIIARASRERLAAARKKRDALAWVPDFLTALESLKKSQTAREKRRVKIDALADLLESLTAAEARAAAASAAAHDAAIVARATDAAVKSAGRLKQLAEIVEALERAERHQRRTAENVEREKRDFKKFTRGKICPICQKPM